MKTVYNKVVLAIILIAAMAGPRIAHAQTTSWKGTVSTSWSNAANWTNGVPNATTDAVIGDASFTGLWDPYISSSAATKNLTIGATNVPLLTIAKALTVNGNLTINSGGSVSHRGVTLTVKGNWTNGGSYTGTSTSSRVNFAGTAQTISATVTPTFRRLSINAGSTVTLQSNIAVNVAMTVSGTFTPAEATPPVVSGSGTLTVDATGILNVTAATYAGNYANTGTTTLAAGSVVSYSATTRAQTVRNNLTYSTLRIIGPSTVKTLAGNLNTLNATTSAAGRIEVQSGTLDLSTFTANRGTTVAGGSLLLFNGATLRLSGASNYPTGFAANDLRITSTVEYYGGAQTVSAQTYGNLSLTGNSGAAVKTMPGTAFTVEGNLTSTQGTATSVSFTAASAITVNGSVSIGTGTTFNGGSFIHNFSGNLTVTGVLTGGTSTIRMAGAGGVIGGAGTHNYFNLTFAATGITAGAEAAVNVSGDLTSVEPGAFTHATGGTFTMSGTGKSITGPNLIFDNLSVTGSVSSAATIEVRGNMTVNGTFTGTGGNIIMSGASKSIAGTGTIVFGSLSPSGTVSTAISFTVNTALDVSGTFTATAGTVTFAAASSLRGTANLFNATVNGTSFTMNSNAVLGVAGAYTVTAGTVDVTTNIPNTVIYNGTGAQNVRAGTYHHLTLGGGGTKTALGATTANGNLSILAGSTFSSGANTHTVFGNWSNLGTFTAGSGTVSLNGTQPADVSGNNTFNILTVNKAAATTAVNLLSNTTVATLNMTSGWMNTGANTVTITTTRNNSGIILGSIKRLHSFAIGTAYAFESPNNLITLTGVNSLTSITVTVRRTTVSDFPAGASVNREYTVTSEGLLNVALVTMRLHYEDDELNGNPEAGLGIWRNNAGTWAALGKSSNSTTSNYVEQTSLLTLNGRYTLSGSVNIARWNGKISSDWHTAGNWSVVQGTPTLPPGPNDIAVVGDTTFVNQPVISAAVSVQGLYFGSVKAATINMTGGSLTTSGNIAGVWTLNATHTINAGNQNITVNGDLQLSDGTAGHSINMNVGNGNLAVTGGVTQAGDAAVTVTGSGNISIGGNYSYSGGTFSAGSGTVTYNGSATQTVAGLNYNNLTIQKPAGAALLAAASTMTGDLAVSSGEFNVSGFNLSARNVTIASGATVQGSTSTITASGNWSNSGTFVPGSGTVVLSGANPQNVSATAFNNLTVSKSSGVATLTGNITLGGNLAITSGGLVLGTFTANRTAAGGSMTMASGTTLNAGGANNFPSGFSSYALNAASSVTYDGAVAQSVAGNITYGNLLFSNGGGAAKTLQNTISVGGNLTINSGATLAGSNYTINLSGNWINGGTFTPGTSTLTLNGAGKTISGNNVFNRVTVYGSYTVAGGDITYNGLLNITATGSYDAGGGTAIVNGDLTNSGSLVSNGTTTFSGTQLQTIRFINAVTSNSTGIINFNGNVAPVLNSTSRPSYATLNINNTAGVTASVGWDVFVAFNISSGATWNSGGGTHNIYGSFTNNGTVTSGGTINFLPAVPRTIQLSGTGFSSTGTVVFGGTGATSVTGSPTSMNNVVISNPGGVTPSANWSMTGSFQIANTAIFNAGSYTFTVGEDIESNGTLNGGTSTFNMTSTSGQGNISGSPGTTFYDLVITGTISAESDYNVSHNFTNNGSYNGEPGTLTMTGPVTGTITSASLASFDLAYFTILKDPGGIVTLGKPLTGVVAMDVSQGIFDIGANTITENAGLMTLEDGGRLIIRGTNSLPAFTDYSVDTLSTVEYAGSTQAISSATEYGNLVISAAGNKTASAILHIMNDFTLTAGTFIPGAFADTIGGNWTMSGGTFTNTGSTMVFAGTGTQQVSTIAPFNNFTVNKAAGFVQLATDVTVNGTLNFLAKNIRTGDMTVIMPTGSNVTGAAQATGWVFGNLRKPVPTGTGVARTLEVGDSLRYAPATLTFASVGTAGTVTAKTVGADLPDLNLSGMDAAKSVNRYWVFTNAGTVFTSVAATLNWNTADVDAGVNAANLRVTNVAGASRTLPVVNSATTTSIAVSGIGALGTMAVAELIASINWSGDLSTNWYTTGNWTGGVVPLQTSNVVIPAGRPNYPNITTGTATANDLSIQTGASVTVSSGLLRISGAMTSSGTFSVNDGSIELNGATAQTIPAGIFAGNEIRNLTVNNAAGVSLGGTLLVNGILKITTGQLSAGSFLTLGSTAARTALIDGSGGGQVTGTVTMLRYVPTGFGYKYLASPFQNATVNELADEVNLASTFPLLYRYDENKTSSGWTAYTTAASPLVPMRGYTANLGTSASPVTIDVAGTVNNGAVSLTLQNNNRPYTKGFQLAGNPYPSPIDWNAATGWTKTNIDDAIYYFNASATDQYGGTYSSFINGISSDGVANNVIPAMQGFFVHVTDGTFPVTGTLGTTNAVRINNLTPVFHRKYPKNAPLLRLSAGFADEGQPSDPAVLYFDTAGVRGFDKEQDALKIYNTDKRVPNLFVQMADKREVSVKSWPVFIDTADVIALRLVTERSGMITFRVENLERMPAGRNIYLYDSAMKRSLQLVPGTQYRLDLPSGDHKERFYLVFAPRGAVGTGEQEGVYYAYVSGGQLFGYFSHAPGDRCTVTVTNMLGQELYRKELSGAGRHALGSGYSGGMYIVSFWTSERTENRKVMIKK
ncbi:hypothetical protein ACQKLP_00790 [Chitinophaga sp. NPDC101104]|uniref:hypothetical protein n=1 Tax=Chitinophaga sp. NPDC101104 TaxID=3390561 RepID=UPI003D08FDF4